MKQKRNLLLGVLCTVLVLALGLGFGWGGRRPVNAADADFSQSGNLISLPTTATKIYDQHTTWGTKPFLSCSGGVLTTGVPAGADLLYYLSNNYFSLPSPVSGAKRVPLFDGTQRELSELHLYYACDVKVTSAYTNDYAWGFGFGKDADGQQVGMSVGVAGGTFRLVYNYGTSTSSGGYLKYEAVAAGTGVPDYQPVRYELDQAIKLEMYLYRNTVTVCVDGKPVLVDYRLPDRLQTYDCALKTSRAALTVTNPVLKIAERTALLRPAEFTAYNNNVEPLADGDTLYDDFNMGAGTLVCKEGALTLNAMVGDGVYQLPAALSGLGFFAKSDGGTLAFADTAVYYAFTVDYLSVQSAWYEVGLAFGYDELGQMNILSTTGTNGAYALKYTNGPGQDKDKYYYQMGRGVPGFSTSRTAPAAGERTRLEYIYLNRELSLYIDNVQVAKIATDSLNAPLFGLFLSQCTVKISDMEMKILADTDLAAMRHDFAPAAERAEIGKAESSVMSDGNRYFDKTGTSGGSIATDDGQLVYVNVEKGSAMGGSAAVAADALNLEYELGRIRAEGSLQLALEDGGEELLSVVHTAGSRSLELRLRQGARELAAIRFADYYASNSYTVRLLTADGKVTLFVSDGKTVRTAQAAFDGGGRRGKMSLRSAAPCMQASRYCILLRDAGGVAPVSFAGNGGTVNAEHYLAGVGRAARFAPSAAKSGDVFVNWTAGGREIGYYTPVAAGDLADGVLALQANYLQGNLLLALRQEVGTFTAEKPSLVRETAGGATLFDETEGSCGHIYREELGSVVWAAAGRTVSTSTPVSLDGYRLSYLLGNRSAAGTVFGGWFTDEAFTQRFDFSQPLASSADLALYARAIQLPTYEGYDLALDDKVVRLHEYFPTSLNTVEVWCKLPTVLSHENVLFSDVNPFISYPTQLSVKTDGTLYWCWNNQEVLWYVRNVDLRTDTWTHVAIVRDEEADEFRCYVNAELVAVQRGAGTDMYINLSNPYGAEPLCFGSDGRELDLFEGRIGEIRFWSEVHSLDELRDNLVADLTGDEEGLLCAWDFTSYTMDPASADKTGELCMGVIQGKGEHPADAYLTKQYVDLDLEVKGDYSFALIPDTQFLSCDYVLGGDYTEFLDATYGWFRDNAARFNLQCVIHLGDMSQQDKPEEWKLMADYFNTLDGIVPYALVPGNHDYANMNTNDKNGTGNFNAAFDYDKIAAWDSFGGAFEEGKLDNTYQLFNVGVAKYMVMTLEYNPRQEVYDWACAAVEKYSDYNVIINTHGYLSEEKKFGQRVIPNIWEKLGKLYPNIVMINCGHLDSSEIYCRKSAGDHGNEVVELLADFQDYRYGGDGAIVLLQFAEDGKKCYVNTYTPYYDKFYKMNNQFELTFQVVPPRQVTRTREYNGGAEQTILEGETVVLDLADYFAFSDARDSFATATVAAGTGSVSGSRVTLRASRLGRTQETIRVSLYDGSCAELTVKLLVRSKSEILGGSDQGGRAEKLLLGEAFSLDLERYFAIDNSPGGSATFADLLLTASAGRVEGSRLTYTPTSAGEQTLTVTAALADGKQAQLNITLDVREPDRVTASESYLEDAATAGEEYALDLRTYFSATGDSSFSDLSFTTTAGRVENGVLRLTPDAAGTVGVTVTAVLKSGASARLEIALEVKAAEGNDTPPPPPPSGGCNSAAAGPLAGLGILTLVASLCGVGRKRARKGRP